MAMALNPQTGIYGDNPRWPLHILRLASTGFIAVSTTCSTPYAAPMTTDPVAFATAMEQGRQVCDDCVAWLKEQGHHIDRLNQPGRR